MATTPLRRWGFGGARLRYLPGHSKGRRREVYAVESRHWAQLQKGPNKEEERKKWRKTKKEEKKIGGDGGGGIWMWKGTGEK